MHEAIRQLRSEARPLAQGTAPTAIRYPVAFREAAIRLTRPQREQGVSRHRGAGALGVPGRSLTR